MLRPQYEGAIPVPRSRAQLQEHGGFSGEQSSNSARRCPMGSAAPAVSRKDSGWTGVELGDNYCSSALQLEAAHLPSCSYSLSPVNTSCKGCVSCCTASKTVVFSGWICSLALYNLNIPNVLPDMVAETEVFTPVSAEGSYCLLVSSLQETIGFYSLAHTAYPQKAQMSLRYGLIWS